MSNETKWTPGPWHVGGVQRCTVYDVRAQRVANSFEGVLAVLRSDEECKANARLIAAAPELAEALEKLIEAAESSDDCQYGTLSTSFVLKIATCALAKARGES